MALKHLPVAWVFALLACGKSERPSGSGFAVEVAPLSLSGVSNTCYRVTVTNGRDRTGAVVWQEDVCADQFGDGIGSLSYVGPCDADVTDENSVTLELLDLMSGTTPTPIDDDTYDNPCAEIDDWDGDRAALADGEDAYGPCTINARCVENSDVLVAFNITVMRDAHQGFFDIAVNFDDIFCSAKLDCNDELLHNAGGERDATAIVAFACTAGANEQTFIQLSDLVLTCDALPPMTIPAAAATPGQHGAIGPGIYQWAAYQGDEQLTSGGQPLEKCYWNRAIGLDRAALVGRNCTLSGVGTATEVPLTQAVLAGAGVSYPIVTWSVPVLTANGTLCGPNPLNVPGSGVQTAYVGPTTNPAPVLALTTGATFVCGVSTDTLAPEIGGVTPTDGALLAASEVSVSFTVTEQNPAEITVGSAGSSSVKILTHAGDRRPVSYVVPLTLLEGEQLLTIIVKDAAGNSSVRDVNLIVDLTAPDVVLKLPDYVNTPNLWAAGEVSDKFGVLDAWFELDGVRVESKYLPGARLVEANLTFSKEGPHEVVLGAKDIAGNVRLLKWLLKFDHTPPTITLDAPADGAVVGAPVTAHVSVADQSPAMVSLWGQVWQYSALAFGMSYVRSLTLPEGLHTLIATATDVAGNTASDSATILVDTTPPIVTTDLEDGLVFWDNDLPIGGTFQWTFHVVDATDTDIEPLPGSQLAVLVGGSRTAYTVQVVTTVQPGLNVLVFTVTDAAGNARTLTRTVTAWTLPDGAPEHGVVALSTDTRTMPKDFLGYNASFKARNAPGDYVDQAILHDVTTAVIRYPGGTIANYFNWQTGFPMDEAHPEGSTAYMLEDLQLAHDTQGAQAVPIFTLNLFTRPAASGSVEPYVLGPNLGRQLNMLRRARFLGLPVERIELGNELYWGKHKCVYRPLDVPGCAEPACDEQCGYSDGASYANMIHSWVIAIKAEFPEAQIALTGYTESDMPTALSFQQTWNLRLFQRLAELGTPFDAFTAHLYLRDDEMLVPNDTGTAWATDPHSRSSGPPLQFHQR